MGFQISSNKCLFCRKLSDLSTKKTAAVFLAWKTECATAICHVLFGKNIDCVVSYLLKANYCIGCEQLVRDVSYVWKQIQSFQNRINSLSMKMFTLLDLNYQLIEKKSQPEVTQERVSLLLDATVPMKIPDYSYEEMVEIIYSVVSSSLKSDLKVRTDSSLSNHVETNTHFVTTYDSPPELFENVNQIKEELLYLEQQAFDPLFNEDKDNTPKIKSEHFNSYSEDYNESVEGSSDCVTHEDVPVNKYVDDASNFSNDYEVEEKKQKRVRSKLKLRKKKRNFSKLYSCDEEGCESQFTCEANKQLHIRKIHKGESKPYNCQQCERKFTSVSHLRRHENRVHEEGRVSKTHNCKFCGTKYIELNDLTSHYSTSHQEPNPFLCAFCPELFQNNLDLTKHTKQSHHQPNVCKVCDTVFTSPSLLNSHEIKRHIGKADWPQCSICGLKSNCQASLKVHMKTHEQSSVLKCEVCNLEFKSSSKLQSHSDLHIEGEFTCEVCGKILPNLFAMKVHKSIHQPIQTVQSESEESNQPVVTKKGRRLKLKVQPIKYNFECKFCSQGYFNEDELNHHYAVAHLGPNPFICAFCPHICSNSIDLIRHMKSVHPDPNLLVGKLKCNLCDRYFANTQSLCVHKRCHLDTSLLLKCHLCTAVFKQRQALNTHLETHSEERKYVCDQCGKAYKSSQYLNKHSRIHDEQQRKYPCKICGKKFFTKAYCKNHERCHTNIKEFVCHVCGKGFNHDFNLREHLKIHAGVPTRRRLKIKTKSTETYPKLP